jgi:hypothetical protein
MGEGMTTLVVKRVGSYEYEVTRVDHDAVWLANGHLSWRESFSRVDRERLAVGAIVRIVTEVRDLPDGSREHVTLTTVAYSPLDGAPGGVA